jgi:hypothetical protein
MVNPSWIQYINSVILRYWWLYNLVGALVSSKTFFQRSSTLLPYIKHPKTIQRPQFRFPNMNALILFKESAFFNMIMVQISDNTACQS